MIHLPKRQQEYQRSRNKCHPTMKVSAPLFTVPMYSRYGDKQFGSVLYIETYMYRNFLTNFDVLAIMARRLQHNNQCPSS